MAEPGERPRRKGPVPLRDLIGGVIDPVVAKRGFASADLVAAWPDIVGPALSGWTAPEKINWPRGKAANEPTTGVLHLRVDGPRAIFVQHEIPQILERINGFFGYRAVGQVRIVQGPVALKPTAPAEARRLVPTARQALDHELSEIESGKLRDALERLGQGVFSRRRE